MRFIPAVSPVRIQVPLPKEGAAFRLRLLNGPLVKWLRHRPFTAVTWVRVPYGSPRRCGLHIVRSGFFLSGQKPLLVFSAAAHFRPIPAFAGIQAGFRVFAKLPCVPCRNSSVITPAAANGVSLAGRVVPLYRSAPRATEARLCMAGFAPVQNNAV